MSRTERKVTLLWIGRPDNAGRDRKPWHKPTSDFKRLKRRARRAKADNALRSGKQPERERREDAYDWL